MPAKRLQSIQFKTREKISGYLDLFFLFIELQVFIWVLFELGHEFRPLLYNAGKLIIGIFLLEVVAQFFLTPGTKTYLKKYWHHFLILVTTIFIYLLFNSVPLTHRYIFIYSRLFLGGIEVILFIKFVIKLGRIQEITRTFKVNPAQLIIVSFASIILIGSFLLYLPYSRPQDTEMRYIDALFTSTSAVCVTGLIVMDTPADFSRLGHIIIAMLIQVGGLGIMTVAAFIQVSLGSQMSIYGRFSTASLLDQTNLRHLYANIRAIVLITFISEAVGVLMFFPFFRNQLDKGMEVIFYSIFHSISAFCNAGFSLYSDSFVRARASFLPNITLMMLIVLGGIGFTVISNMVSRIIRGRKERISVQTRIVLIVTAFLIVSGAVGFYLFEKDYILRGMKPFEGIMASLFQSVTARTAGFNTVDISALRPITLFMIIILMFLGASPGSTGGGIKTTTFFILILSIITILRDQRFNTIFQRRIPFQVVNRAFAILVSAMGVVITATLLLGFTEKFSFMQIFFEVVSAFGTVGLSTGITPHLSDFGKIVIILCMFTGRLGPLTMVLAVRNLQATRLVTYPEERVMVG